MQDCSPQRPARTPGRETVSSLPGVHAPGRKGTSPPLSLFQPTVISTITTFTVIATASEQAPPIRTQINSNTIMICCAPAKTRSSLLQVLWWWCSLWLIICLIHKDKPHHWLFWFLFLQRWNSVQSDMATSQVSRVWLKRCRCRARYGGKNELKSNLRIL